MSIRKRQWRTRTGEEKAAWVVDFADGAGVRRLRTFAKKREAEAFEATTRVQIAEGSHVADSSEKTVADMLDRWINHVEADGRERATVAQYRQHVRLHIRPQIGGLKLAKLTTAHIERFRDHLLTTVSRPMARKVLVSLKSSLKLARRTHLAAGVSIGRDKRAERKVEAGRDFPSPDEVRRLIDAAENPKHRALLLVAALTGLRSSELRALRWNDLDLTHGELHVRTRADRYGTVGAPKSESSVRTVPLDHAVLIPALKMWKIACPISEAGYVFPTSTGRIDHHSNLLRALAPIMVRAGVVDRAGRPKYALHAFRHFFASWGISPRERGGRGLPLKVLQEMLGHSSVVMTSDVYAHLLPRGDDRAELAASARALLG